MNALQETILDRLMAADHIGAVWTPGPLRLAGEALQGAGLTDPATTPDEAVGYPHIFCRTLEGASGVLADVDEVRTLAITVFSEVPPRPLPPTLLPRRQVEVASWAVRQIRLYHAGLAAPVEKVEGLLEDFLAGRQVASSQIDTLSGELSRAIGRVREKYAGAFCNGRLALGAFYFALHALRLTVVGKEPQENAARACRDAARLATLARGLQGAVPYCLALARTLGM